MAEREPAGLRIVSYNVHRWTGTDGRFAPGRIASVLLECDADVAALQEVDGGPPDTPGEAPLDRLARRLGCALVRGPTLEAEGYGNALLSRLPVRAVRRLDLSVRRREPRGALDVELGRGDRRLRVVATHLGLAWAERRRQVRRLLEALGPPDADQVLVVLGDMNEWWAAGGSLGPLHRAFGRPPAARTFPSRWPLAALDRVWVHPRQRLGRVAAHASPGARVASDHLPLVATLRWSARSGVDSTQSPTPRGRRAVPRRHSRWVEQPEYGTARALRPSRRNEKV